MRTSTNRSVIMDHGFTFDLEVPAETEVERLITLGAGLAGEPREWWPMISPGGMPFCLIRRRDHVRPLPVSWDGHHSRLMQVCIDSPAGLHRGGSGFLAVSAELALGE
jgi:hypothetical protein